MPYLCLICKSKFEDEHKPPLGLRQHQALHGGQGAADLAEASVHGPSPPVHGTDHPACNADLAKRFVQCPSCGRNALTADPREHAFATLVRDVAGFLGGNPQGRIRDEQEMFVAMVLVLLETGIMPPDMRQAVLEKEGLTEAELETRHLEIRRKWEAHKKQIGLPSGPLRSC